MKLKVVYFAYLLPYKWEPIVKEQLSVLKTSGLYNEAKDIFMSVVSNNQELEKLKQLMLEKNYHKIKLTNVFNENFYEYPGIKTLCDIAEDDANTYLLYFHSKGMTSNCTEHRQKLNKYHISNYKNCIAAFENKEVDVVCAIPHPTGFAYFNFFWARANYIKKHVPMPVPSANRFIWEVWIGSRKKNVVTYSPVLGRSTVNTCNGALHVINNILNLNKTTNKKICLL